MERNTSTETAALTERSISLMLLLILGLLLSLFSLLLQRDQTADASGDRPESAALLRRAAGVLTLWCAGGFLLLSLRSRQATASSSEAQLQNADTSASLLALIAALLRLWVIEQSTLPRPPGAEGGSLPPALLNILPA